MESRPRWLTDEEQVAWRAFLAASQLLDEALDRQLQRDSQMPHTYYMVLTTLVEASEPMRMSDLAERLRFSASRLTHAVARMERSGWIERRACPTDKRGQLAVITPAGERVQHAAAAGHVSEVRARLFDHLSSEQVEQLREICLAVVTGFEEDGSATLG